MEGVLSLTGKTALRASSVVSVGQVAAVVGIGLNHVQLGKNILAELLLFVTRSERCCRVFLCAFSGGNFYLINLFFFCLKCFKDSFSDLR